MTQNKIALATGAAGLVAGIFLGRLPHHRSVKKLLGDNHKLLTASDRKLVRTLVSQGHGHLFQHWPPLGVRDAQKKQLLQTAARYMTQARASLEDARLEVLVPPKTVKRPHKLEMHNDIREDSYYWLRDDDRKNSEILEHLEEENKYTKAVMADTEQLQEQLFKEMKGRIQEADQSTAQRHDKYFYYTRTVEGKQYTVYCRRKIPEGMGPPSELDVMDESIPEEVLLDENKEAEKHEFYMVGAFEVSLDHNLLAFAVDTSGNEKYTLYIKDLSKNKIISDAIPDTAGNCVWANDNATLFYCVKDKLDRPFKVFRHRVGSSAREDQLVYHEQDDAFYVGLSKARSDRLIYIGAGSAITNEIRVLDADTPHGEPKPVFPRQEDVEYGVSHRGRHLFITVRDPKRPNSELLVAPMEDPSNTKVLIPHRPDIKLESVEVSKNHLTVFERIQGLQVATVYRLPDGDAAPEELENGQQIKFDEPAYELGPGSQGDFESDVLRLAYTSLTTPTSTIDYNMVSGSRAVKKVQIVLGGFDQARYHTERLWAPAPDGKQVPISLVYRRDAVKLDGSDPLLLDGYGAYEICNDPYFSSARVSLLDRGFVFAIAHVRGGGEMGRNWYEDGKYLHKVNTITDFIAAAEHLIQRKYTSPAGLCIEGRSAGGIVIGGAINKRPDLFCGAIAGVPFVDCLTTMLDETIPLTVIEWEEWGNPKNPEYYDYMKSYAPIDNVAPQPYPHLLVTAGLHDPRVGYWEPAKWVAALREQRTNDNLLLFKCDMGAGHFSKSGRFDKLKEVALEFAFLVKVTGRAGQEVAGGEGQ